MTVRITWILIVFISTFSLNAQDASKSEKNPLHTEQCAHTTIHERMMEESPMYRNEQESREEALTELIRQYRTGAIPKNDEIFTIPVVVHIIHDGDAYGTGSNITDEQVYSAINGLNEDYRKMPGTNGDGDGEDIGVEFCLAQRDPDGNPTTGINRVNGCSVTDYCSEGITAGNGQGASEITVKNLSRWPNQEYYNIWVVTEIENNNGGGGIQGYAYFPTTSAVDGTVVLYNAFGTEGNLKSYTDLNRTITHELGHAFALFHTFQGGSCSESNCAIQGDRVCDTPPTSLNSSCNSPACGGTQQVENYMDYTSENCKNMFSQGQKERMRLAIQNSRPNLIASNGCEPIAPILADAGISDILEPTGNLCTNLITPQVELTNYGSTVLSNATIQYRTGGSWVNFDWNGTLGGGQSTIITLPEYDGGWGSNTLEVRTTMPNGNSDTDSSNDQTTGNYSAVLNAHNLSLSITLDALGSQTTWEIRDSGNDVIASGGPYANFQTGSVETASICATDGCFDFVIMDSNGNGICCVNGNGSYELLDDDGNVLASGGEFDSQETTNFCLSAGGELPVADFSANQTTICQGESITFTNESSGSPDSYDWKFFGGSPFTTTDESPGTITYNTPGTYDVRLVATNAFGEDIELKTDYITVLGTQTWFADNDNDGYGDPNTTTESCSQPAGYVPNGDDCDDTDGTDWNSCYDCAGVMNGTAVEDNCGVCDSNPANDCVQDCEGTWGGSAYVDNCGVCDDNPANDCVQDCEGTWGGSSYEDNCGVCDDNSANDCVQDCAGTWGGSAYEDNCGVCDDNPANDCIQDCAGTWGGSAYVDNCGVCDDNPANDCVQDCEGTWGGSAYEDNCGVCDDNPANDCVQDCAGTWGGSAYEDNCGVCDDNPANDCVQDCAGTWGGSAYEDNCGICDDNPANDCIQDCEGTWGGSAYFDDCGTCDDIPENDCIPCDELNIEVLSTVHPTCFGDENGSIEISVTSTDGTHTLSWEDGSDQLLRENLGAGTYQVTASYEDCTAFLEITLEEPEEIDIQIEDLNHIPCDESDLGSATINVEGGLEPYSITLDGNDVNEGTWNNLEAGTYNILVTDANSCATSTIFEILELECEELAPTSIDGEICEDGILLINESIICAPVQNALEYEWSFTNTINDELIYISPSNEVNIQDITGLIPEDSYTVHVRGLNPDYISEFGAECSLYISIPSSSLLDEFCGNMELYMESTIEANEVISAEEYEFTFTDTETLERYYYYSDQAECTLENVVGLELNKLYSVAVRVQYRNIWSDFGSLCQITIIPTPLMTMLEDAWCGNLSINYAYDVLTVQPIDGASVYQLKLSGGEIETELLFYSESPSFEAYSLDGLNAMTEYNAEVRAMVDGSWTIWGETCSIAFNQPQPLKLNMFIYPNPALSSQSTVNLRTEGDWQNMELVLYNSMGRLENEKNIDFTNMQPQKFDISNLDPGMYFLIVKHGKQTLTEKLLIQ